MPSNENHRLRQRGGKSRVTFVFGDGNHAGLGNGEIRAGDADVRREKFFAERTPRDHCEFFGSFVGVLAEFALEQFADLAARQVASRETRCDTALRGEAGR